MKMQNKTKPKKIIIAKQITHTSPFLINLLFALQTLSRPSSSKKPSYFPKRVSGIQQRSGSVLLNQSTVLFQTGSTVKPPPLTSQALKLHPRMSFN